jgi:hypothetical protein
LHTEAEKVYFLDCPLFAKESSIHQEKPQSGNEMKAKITLHFLLALILALFLAGSLGAIYGNMLVKQKLERQGFQLLQLQELAARGAADSASQSLPSELVQSNLDCRATLIRAIWLTILLTACGFALTHKMYYHIQATLLKPIDKITGSLSELLTEELQLRRLPVNRDSALFQLAETCNLMLDNWQREKDHQQQVFRMLQKTAMQLIEIFEEPTVAMVGSKEMLLANNNAKDFFIGEGGQRLFQYLSEAIRQEHSEFVSHGLRYTIKIPAQPKYKPDALITVYQFQCAGKIEPEGPKKEG